MKQIHLRLDDIQYNELIEYSEKRDATLQDCLREAILSYLSNEKKSSVKEQNLFTFIDLFAGIGGMRIAFEANGGKCKFSSEWDKYCQTTYFANFGEFPKGDITQVEEAYIPDHDILVAGFPCQPFSLAGVSKKNSMGRETGFLDKTQGTLFFDVARIIRAKRPKAILLENVKNLKGHDKGKTWEVIQKTLDELDYEIYYEIVDGQDFVPQHRERIFIVGFDKKRYKGNIPFAFKLNKPNIKPQLKDILLDDIDKKYTLSDGLWQYLQEYARKHKEKGNGFGYGLPDRDGIARTLSARYYKDGSEILISQEDCNPRKLTPRECARLQGYDDEFKIVVSDTQAYKQFGNSVVVPLVKEIARNIVETLTELEIRNVKSLHEPITVSQEECENQLSMPNNDFKSISTMI